MRTLKMFIATALLVAIGTNLSAQTDSKSHGPKTESFKVWGNCGMCKNRIETTAKSEGAINATWDAKTKLLTVSFDPLKTSIDGISKKIAIEGHDNEKYRTDDKVYSSLPACCHYKRIK